MKGKKAFTLIELMSVIVVIGILIAATAIIIPKVTQKSKATADQSTLSTLNEALNQYKLVGGDASVFTEGMPAHAPSKS